MSRQKINFRAVNGASIVKQPFETFDKSRSKILINLLSEVVDVGYIQHIVPDEVFSCVIGCDFFTCVVFPQSKIERHQMRMAELPHSHQCNDRLSNHCVE